MKHVQLEFDCDKNYNNFDKTQLGGFCQSCNKEVVDYSHLTLEEVVAQIKQRPGGCGRFAIEHTNPNIIAEWEISKKWFAFGMSLSFLFGVQSTEIKAQEKSKTELVESTSFGENVPQNHRNVERICPKSNVKVEPNQKTAYRPRRRVYLIRAFPFIIIARPRMGKFKPMGCPKF